jgi:hypothetical protein
MLRVEFVSFMYVCMRLYVCMHVFMLRVDTSLLEMTFPERVHIDY